MNSFYGGRYGKDFQIVKIFNNKISLEEDLNQSSEINPGDLVFISYGDKKFDNYIENFNKDLSKYLKTYNNTLWKKVYTLVEQENLSSIEIITSESNPNLHYYLLADITGASPLIDIKQVDTIGVQEKAYVEIDNTNSDKPLLTFGIPKGSEIFSGTEIDSDNSENIVENSLIGDYYLNSDSGNLYQLNEEQKWKYKASLRGKAGNIQIGSVSSGSTPSVTNSGTETDAIFNFVLPKGDKGDRSTITIGTISTGEANVTNTGTDTDAIFNFTLPPGEQGIQGQAATIRIGSVSVGQAAVENVGNENDAILNFTLPRGEQGNPGPALNIVANYLIDSNIVPEDTTELIGQYIYNQYGKYPESNELIAISYTNLTEDITNSYWYFYLQNNWNKVILTGGISDLIKDSYSILNETNKGYSINYINKIISSNPTEKDRQTYSADQIDSIISWGEF